MWKSTFAIFGLISELILMFSNWNKELGFWGEGIARDYLLNQNYQLVDRNVCWDRGEIDLVMKIKDCLVFVEVKTKVDGYRGEPADLVTSVKLRQILGLIEGLLADEKTRKKWQIKPGVSWSVDVVAVYGDGIRVKQILHFENVTMWM